MTPNEVEIRHCLVLTYERAETELGDLQNRIRILTEGEYEQDEQALQECLKRQPRLFTQLGWRLMVLEAFDAGLYWAAKMHFGTQRTRVVRRMRQDPASEDFRIWEHQIRLYNQFIEVMEQLESQRQMAA